MSRDLDPQELRAVAPQLYALVRAAQTMRTHQRSYFATRSAEALGAARKAELLFDAGAADLMGKLGGSGQ